MVYYKIYYKEVVNYILKVYFINLNLETVSGPSLTNKLRQK